MRFEERQKLKALRRHAYRLIRTRPYGDSQTDNENIYQIWVLVRELLRERVTKEKP